MRGSEKPYSKSTPNPFANEIADEGAVVRTSHLIGETQLRP